MTPYGLCTITRQCISREGHGDGHNFASGPRTKPELTFEEVNRLVDRAEGLEAAIQSVRKIIEEFEVRPSCTGFAARLREVLPEGAPLLTKERAAEIRAEQEAREIMEIAFRTPYSGEAISAMLHMARTIVATKKETEE
jgi:hypothetical protein